MLPGRISPARFFMKKKISFIGSKRRIFQWTTTLLLLLIPWLEIDSRSMIRIDIPGLSLYLFGQVLRIQNLFFVLLATLIFVLGFLLITVVLGRIWCGWCCPQTTLSDVSEWTAKHLGLVVRNNKVHGSLLKKALLQCCFLLLGLIMASNLIWYFIPPRVFFLRLFTFDLHYATWITFGATALLVYLDLAFVRRLLCRDLCPYGRIQTALVDKATLTLHLPESEQERCIDCHSCMRCCPMEIDIRQGYQVECTNCCRCLDACRQVMSKRNEPGLIHYTFGLHGESAKGLLNPRVLLPAFAMLVLAVILAVSLINRPAASLKIAVSHTAPPRILKDGRIGTFFDGWVNNRTQKPAAYIVSARTRETKAPLALKGQTKVELKAGANQHLNFVLVTQSKKSQTVEFVLTGKDGLELSLVEAYIGKTVGK